MFSIQKLFAKDDQILELLSASAQAGRDSIQTLRGVLQKGGASRGLEDFAATRRKDKAITGQITELLARSTITSLDREDIEAISTALYKIPKTAEKFAERYLACSSQLGGLDFSKQVALAEQATETVVAIIQALEKSRFAEVSAFNGKLQTIEGDADKLMLELLTELYSGRHEPLTVFMVKDLYELLEKVVDRCRDVGNVVANVVLKHS
jgi:uncharacterized protein